MRFARWERRLAFDDKAEKIMKERVSSRRWEDTRFAAQPGSLLYLVGAFEVRGDEGGLTPFGNGILIVARGIALSFAQV